MTSSANPRVAVWLDHHEAHVFYLEESNFDESTFRSPRHHLRRSPDRDAEKNNPEDLKHFFHDLSGALDSAGEVLILGPSTAKLQFLKYVHAHDAKLADRIVGVETVDHPTAPQIAAFARRYFHAANRMRGLVP